MRKTKKTISILLALTVITGFFAAIPAGAAAYGSSSSIISATTPPYNGWFQDNGNWYYMIDGTFHIGWIENNGDWYYIKSNNARASNEWLQINEAWYYFDASGVMTKGWTRQQGTWYYLKQDGARATNEWVQDNSQWYFLDSGGAMVTGERQIGGVTYSFSPGGVMNTGWVRQGNSWYYYGSDGAKYINRWLLEDKVWYYLGSDGIMVTGAQQIGGTNFYFMPGGAMATGWLYLNGAWYYFDDGGAMLTGKWLEEDNLWYYLKSNGTMAAGETLVIDGMKYTFGNDGVWLAPVPVINVADFVWSFLKSKGLNDFAAAGIIGNLQAESALRPNNLENAYERILGFTDESYTAAVDSGAYTKFATDAAGYGLAQWTYSTRKAGLLEFARANHTSIADPHMQMEYLWKELTSSYRGVLNALMVAESVREASDVFMVNFENPADQSERAKAYRADLSQSFYDKYATPVIIPAKYF